jgi:L-alanine-DL-glutamate epimerase-like enolase superfamily enzyme
MKITDIQTILLTGSSTNDPFFLEARQLRSVALIEIHTDGPHTGVGESYAGYFCPEVVPAIVDFYRPILLDADPGDVHMLTRRMAQCGAYWSRVGLGTAVLAGIEAALWDLKGKLLGLPVYELLGGRRHDRLLAYATGGVSNWPPDRLKAKIDFYLGLGFRAFKVGAGYYDAATHDAVPAPSTSAILEIEAGKAALMRAHPDGRAYGQPARRGLGSRDRPRGAEGAGAVRSVLL